MCEYHTKYITELDIRSLALKAVQKTHVTTDGKEMTKIFKYLEN